MCYHLGVSLAFELDALCLEDVLQLVAVVDGAVMCDGHAIPVVCVRVRVFVRLACIIQLLLIKPLQYLKLNNNYNN